MERQGESNALLALSVEIDPAHGPRHLVEADIVKALEASAHNLADTVVGHEERLLPAHEDVFALRIVLVLEVWILGLFGQGPPGGEAGPVLHVGLIGGAPGGVAGLKCMLGANDLTFEVGG